MGIFSKSKSQVTAPELTTADRAAATQGVGLALLAEAVESLRQAADLNRQVVLESSDGIKRSAEILASTIHAAEQNHEARRNELTVVGEEAERQAREAAIVVDAVDKAIG